MSLVLITECLAFLFFGWKQYIVEAHINLKVTLPYQGYIAFKGFLDIIIKLGFYHIYIHTHQLRYTIVFAIPSSAFDAGGCENIFTPTVVNIHSK